jgi:hypothetical protein
MARAYGRLPSELLDPTGAMGEYAAFCLNEAVYMRATVEENIRYTEQRDALNLPRDDDERAGQRTERGAHADLPDLDLEKPVPVTGEWVVGQIEEARARSYIAGGGSLPPTMLITRQGKAPVEFAQWSKSQGRTRRGAS